MCQAIIITDTYTALTVHTHWAKQSPLCFCVALGTGLGTRYITLYHTGNIPPKHSFSVFSNKHLLNVYYVQSLLIRPRHLLEVGILILSKMKLRYREIN